MDCKQELQWWIENSRICNGKGLIQGPPDLIIESDASKKGWGARCQRQSTGGAWTYHESQYHINILELTTAKLALQTYCMFMWTTKLRLPT